MSEQNSKFESYKNNIKLCTKLLSKPSDDITMKRNYQIRASNYYKLKCYDEAIQDLKLIMEIDNEFIHSHQLLGQCFDGLGRYKEGIDSFDAVLCLNSKHINARLAKASLLNKLGQLTQSVNEQDQALGLEENDELSKLNDTNYFDYYKSDISSSRSISNNGLSFPRTDDRNIDHEQNERNTNINPNYNYKNQIGKSPILSIDKMIISPGLKNEPGQPFVHQQNEFVHKKHNIMKNVDNTISLRMSEIDSYPTDNELPTENNRKIIKDFKIKDLIKYKREKSREKSRDCNYVKKISAPVFELNYDEINLKINNNISNIIPTENTKNAINNHFNRFKLNEMNSNHDQLMQDKINDNQQINQYDDFKLAPEFSNYTSKDCLKENSNTTPDKKSSLNDQNSHLSKIHSNQTDSVNSNQDQKHITDLNINQTPDKNSTNGNLGMSGSSQEQDYQNGNNNHIISKPLINININNDIEANTIVKGNLKESSSHLLQEAYNLRKKNLFTESIAIYNKAVQMQPDNQKIQFNRGQTQDKLNDLCRSKQDQEKSHQLNPNNNFTLFNLANVCMKQNELKSALKYATESNKLVKNSNTLMLIANINKKLKNYQEAIDTLHEIIDIDPISSNAYLMLAGLYDNIKDYNLIIKTIDDLLLIKNLKPKVLLDSYYKRSLAYEKLFDTNGDPKQLKMSENDITHCIDSEDIFQNSDYYNLRGLIFYKQKRYDLSMQDFNSAIELNQNNFVQYYNRSCCQRAQDNFNESYKDIDTAIGLSPLNYNLYLNKAFLSRKLGYVQESIDLLDTQISNTKEGENLKGYLNRAFCQAKLNDITKAIADQSAVITLDPTKVDAHHNRGILYQRMNQYKEALADFNKIIELDDRNPNCYFQRGSCLEALGSEEEAMRDFQIALDLDDTNDI